MAYVVGRLSKRDLVDRFRDWAADLKMYVEALEEQKEGGRASTNG